MNTNQKAQAALIKAVIEVLPMKKIVATAKDVSGPWGDRSDLRADVKSVADDWSVHLLRVVVDRIEDGIAREVKREIMRRVEIIKRRGGDYTISVKGERK